VDHDATVVRLALQQTCGLIFEVSENGNVETLVGEVWDEDVSSVAGTADAHGLLFSESNARQTR